MFHFAHLWKIFTSDELVPAFAHRNWKLRFKVNKARNVAVVSSIDRWIESADKINNTLTITLIHSHLKLFVSSLKVFQKHKKIRKKSSRSIFTTETVIQYCSWELSFRMKSSVGKLCLGKYTGFPMQMDFKSFNRNYSVFNSD